MKLTTAQAWLVHTLETLFFGAVVTGAISVYQAIGSGNYSPVSLAGIFVPAVIALLSKGASSVMLNAQTGQAESDTLAELKGQLAGVLSGHGAILNALHLVLSQQVPAGAQVVSATVAAPAAQGAPASSVPQMPFPDRPTFPLSAVNMPGAASQATATQVRH